MLSRTWGHISSGNEVATASCAEARVGVLVSAPAMIPAV